MTGILEHLKWVSLKKQRRVRLVLLYKGLKGKGRIPTVDLIPLVIRCRNHHSMAYQVPIANTAIYMCSFFPQTIRDWNALPDSPISPAECVEDGVAKITSLAREGLVSLVLVLVIDCRSVNNSDSEHYQEIRCFSYLILNFNMYNII